MRTTIVVVVVLIVATAALARRRETRRAAPTRRTRGTRSVWATTRAPPKPCRSEVAMSITIATCSRACGRTVSTPDSHPHPAGYAARDRRQEDHGESPSANGRRNRTGAAASTDLTRAATSSVSTPPVTARPSHPCRRSSGRSCRAWQCRHRHRCRPGAKMTKRPTDRRPFALSRNTTCCLALPRGSVVFMIRGYGQTIRPPTDALHQHPVAAGNVAPRIGDRFDPGLFELVPELDDLRVLISPLAPEFPDLLVRELRPFELP
jgi:hypothetical protein